MSTAWWSATRRSVVLPAAAGVILAVPAASAAAPHGLRLIVTGSTIDDNTGTNGGAGIANDGGTSCHLAKPTDLTSSDPKLGPLADNGGATHTRAPAPGSAAIGRGGTRVTGCPATDQRGLPRRHGQPCDIGAVEVRPG